MNWVRNNRFLAAFLGVVIVVGGVLAFLLFSAYGRYSEVSQQYTAQTQEMNRLQQLDLYPNEPNLKKYEEVRKNYQLSVNDLQGKLAALEPPMASPALTPLGFQDKLRKVVEDTVAQAQVAGVGLPQDFYLGFEQYRASPPDTASTPLLTQHLDSIQNLVSLLIQQHIEKITVIKRGALPQEGGGNALVAAGAAPANARPGAPAAPALVAKYPLEVSFTALPSSFRDSLNKITSDKELYIIRTLQVKNQADKGPSRTPEGMPIGPNGQPVGMPVATGGAGAVDASGVPVPALPDKGPPPLRYVVGQEKLDITARIEIASVKPPAAAK